MCEVEIYYFSGTGNSLYVAKELQKRIPVKKFIYKLDLKSTKYIFAIATRDSTKHRAFTEIDKILKKSGKSLVSYFTLNMASNDPKFEDWHPPTKEKIAKLEFEVQNKLDSIQKIIINKESSQEKDSNFIIPVNFAVERLVLLGMAYAEYNGAKDYFYSDSKCTVAVHVSIIAQHKRFKLSPRSI